MNSKNVGYIGALAMFAAGMSYHHNKQQTYNEDIINKPEPKEIIPKGCNKYYFTASGRCITNNEGTGYNIVYTCIAISKKSAIKKYEKYNKNLNNNL